jgi:hypothetical protein
MAGFTAFNSKMLLVVNFSFSSTISLVATTRFTLLKKHSQPNQANYLPKHIPGSSKPLESAGYMRLISDFDRTIFLYFELHCSKYID